MALDNSAKGNVWKPKVYPCVKAKINCQKNGINFFWTLETKEKLIATISFIYETYIIE